MNESELIFKRFDNLYIWDYRDNAYGCDLIYTHKESKKTNVITSFNLEDCFNKAFESVFS